MKHLRQMSCLLVLILGFYSCEENTRKDNIQLKDIQLNLKNQLSYGHFFPQRELAFSVNQEAISLKNIPQDFTDYEVKSFTFNLAQAYYEDYKTGKISAEEFHMLQQIYKIDTTQISSQNKASKVYLVIGELANGNRAVVVDTNLDLDFADEELQEFEYPIVFIDEDDEAFYERNKIKFLPKARVTYGENEADQFILLINPYEEDMSSSSYPDRYFLSLSIPQIKTQVVEIKDKKFVIEAKSNFTQVGTQAEKLQFLAFEKKDSVEVDMEINTLHFQVGDTLNLNQYDFSLNYEEGEYRLKNLGFNAKPTGVTEGFYIPKINTNYIDGTPYSARAFQGKTQLFYFWTTWSLPSLEDVNQLKELQENQEDLAIVGVAVDANQGAVERMIARQEMNWKTLYASSEQANDKKPALQFKVMSFPTYILVDDEQKILQRTHHLKEVIDVLRNLENLQ